MQKIGKCKLCQQEKPLQNKSHIIPEFMYENLFDNQHRLHKFAPKDFIEGKGRISKPHSGEYEGEILCQKCDNEIIGSYETYARKALYGKVGQDADLPECSIFITKGGVKFTKCKNLHYKEFKLFLLSVLWRASISSRDFFREVNLGHYEETIRQMILDGDPKGIEFFPILMLTWIYDKSFSSDGLSQPGINRRENGVRYVFPIGGLTYIYHISPTSLRKELTEFLLLPSNEASLIHYPEGKTLELFHNYWS